MHQQHQRRRQQLVCRAGPPPPPQVSTTTVQQPQRQPPQQPPPKARKLQRHERLRDPAKIGAQGSATVSVNDAGGPVSLATYMQLPVEQYYILDPNQITLLSGNTFILSVPTKINLLGASLQPVITVEVTTGALHFDCGRVLAFWLPLVRQQVLAFWLQLVLQQVLAVNPRLL